MSAGDTNAKLQPSPWPAYLGPAGEMGARIRTHGWAGTPLGPIETWPQSLRTVVDLLLGSRVAMALVWGRESILLYNDAAAGLIGWRHPSILGQSVLEAFPEVRDVLAPQLMEAWTGQSVQLVDQLYPFVRNDVLEDAWFDISFNPVRNEQGSIAGILGILTETTSRVLAAREHAKTEAERREREAHQAYLLKLSDALRPLRDPVEIQATAGRLFGEHLGANRVFYMDLVNETEAVIHRDYVNGVSSIAGRYPAVSFGTGAARIQRSETLVYNDVAADPSLSGAKLRELEATEVASTMCVNLVKGDHWVASFAAQSSKPRVWTPAEIALLEETAERTWAAVERARAEAARHASEQRLQRVFETDAVGVLIFDGTGTVIDANRAFRHMTGYTWAQVDRRELTWRRMTPPEWLEDSEKQMQKLAATGRIGPYEKEYFCADGSRRWMFFAGRDLADGTISEYCIDVTDRKQAEAALRESEARLAADLAGMRRLYDLHAKIATETNLKTALDEILAAACVFTGTDRGCLQLVDDGGTRLRMVAHCGYEENSPFIEYFRHNTFEQGCEVVRVERRRLIIEDLKAHPGLDGTEAGAAILAAGIRAMQSTPLVSRKGETVGVLSTQFPKAHRPGDDELRLIDLLAWTAADFVERHRAEAALRASEARQAFLLKLSDASRLLSDPVAIQETACQMVAEHLAVSRAVYAELKPEEDEVIIDREFVRAGQSMAGRYPWGAFVTDDVLSSLEGGELLVINDSATDPRLGAEQRSTYTAAGMIAVLSCGFKKNGRWVAAFGVHSATPRVWTQEEKWLVQELAERTWVAVEHARAEAALRESEERFRLLVENVQEYALFQTDLQGLVTSWNPGAQRLFGYISAEMLGQPASRLLTPQDQRSGVLNREIDRVLLGEHPEDARWMVRKDGTRFWAHWVTEPVYEEAGQLRGIAKVLRDETDRQRAEQAIRTSLTEKEALLKEVHHRVKNNLQVITSLLNLQAGQVEDKRVLALFDEARNRVYSIAAIHELLYRSASFAAIDLTDYARQLVPQLVRFYGADTRVELRVIGSGATLELERAVPFGLLLNELVSNACKHAFPGAKPGTLTVSLNQEDNHISLVIADTGVGLPPGFDYTHASSLGLQLVHNLTHQLQGTVTVSSGAGTTVTVRLPKRIRAMSEEAQ